MVVGPQNRFHRTLHSCPNSDIIILYIATFNNSSGYFSIGILLNQIIINIIVAINVRLVYGMAVQCLDHASLNTEVTAEALCGSIPSYRNGHSLELAVIIVRSCDFKQRLSFDDYERLCLRITYT